MKKITLLLALIPSLLFAQEKGVNFQQDLSWEQVKAKAKAEHKYIMMDCYTTWCGWCKYMDKNIYPLDSVAQMANAQFISIRVQYDSSANDNQQVKDYYQLAHEFADKYNVHAYPTFLFFDPNGAILQKAVGASMDGTSFMKVLADAQNPDKQYYALLKKYNEGDKKPEFLKTMALAADASFDPKVASKASSEYIATQKDLYTKDNLTFISQFTQSSKDKGFDIMLNHPDKVDAVMGAGSADKIVQGIIMKEEVFPVIFPAHVKAKDLQEPNWTAIQTNVQAKYPSKADEVMSYSKVVFYENKSDWNNFATAVVAYMKSYGSSATNDQLNDFAWNVFQNCSDMTCVAQALDWSKKSFDGNNNPAFIDTYANILYKMGKTDEAIQWETKAAAQDQSLQGTLDKMKKGEKTWD